MHHHRQPLQTLSRQGRTDLIGFQRSSGVVGDFDSGCETVEDAIFLQMRMTLSGDEYSGLGVTEDVVVFEEPSSPVEDTNAAISSVVDFISL